MYIGQCHSPDLPPSFLPSSGSSGSFSMFASLLLLCKWMIQTNSMTCCFRERKSLVHIVLPLLSEGREFSDFKGGFYIAYSEPKHGRLEETVWEPNLFYCPRLTIFFVREDLKICMPTAVHALRDFQIRTFASEKYYRDFLTRSSFLRKKQYNNVK